MSELNLIAVYNKAANNTVVTPSFLLDEIQRRRIEALNKERDEQADRMEAQGRRMERLTRAIFALTAVNVLIVVLAFASDIARNIIG